MKYLGSKNRISSEILPIILKNRKEGQYFVDVFTGGGNLVDKVTGPRIANDINSYVIACLKAVSEGWIPPDNISEELYREIKNNIEKFTPELVGFVGIGCSFGAKWFGGFARGKNNNGQWRNYALESRDNLLKQASNLKGIIFESMDYRQLSIPFNSVIYADPPYRGATKYRDTFNHDDFWKWADSKVEEFNTVFVSEYNAPSHWKPIWSKELSSSFDLNRKTNGGKIGIERLFIHESQHKNY